ncbi:hypothetical protein FRX31_009078 [Thalictrum thalictroides]|uniref:NB-ARC domain-containing protein n=1 Tax=Thalictrum thalictroides TaxID=46969 RepID=A0A7J6WV92_THATH|nr:hypothetical protein FRX31_009078 [Thalictrum thalictroides]
MVLMHELLDQSGARIEQILSSLKQDLPELELEHYATRLQEILETFQKMCESLQPVHHLFKGLDLESIPELRISSQVLLHLLLTNSQGSEEEGELVEAVSSNNGRLELSVQQMVIEAPKYEYQGILLPSQLMHMETIWDWLNNDRVGTIVIEGEAGMGKTWMARQLKDRAITANLFDVVIWMDPNQETLLEAQEHIVDQLGLSITREPGEERYDKKDLMREVALSLGKKSYLLIINNFTFCGLDLGDFGFSEPWQQNVSSKVLISGPEFYIEPIEKDKICRVELLDKNEAWLLFLGITGLDLDSPYVLEIAQPLVSSFEGVPSVIVSREGDVAELTNRVCNFLNSGNMEVIECLRFCSSLTAEDRIEVKDFIPWWIVEVFDDIFSLEEAYEKAHHTLQELIDGQILERNETQMWVKTLVPCLTLTFSKAVL